MEENGAVTADGYFFHVGLRVCVGMGGSQACEWAADHRSRLYSQFRVFSRSRYVGGIVRSWTLTTRGGVGLVAIRRPRRTSIRRLAPADYFMSPASVRLVAPDATPALFRSIVAPIAARLTQQQNTTDCTAR